MKKLLRYALLLAVAGAWTTACNSGNDSDGSNEPPASTLSPDQHKEKLENLGKEFAGYFDSEESRAAIKSLQELLELAPTNEEEPGTGVSPVALSLMKAVRSNDPALLLGDVTRAAVRYSIAGELGSNGMTYTYDYTAGAWTKTPTDERCLTVVYGQGDQASELRTIYAAEKVDYVYTPDNVVVEVPASIGVTLTVGGKTELKLDVRPNLSADGKTIKPEVDFTHASLVCTVRGEANPQFITATSRIEKNGTMLVDAYAKVAVSDMTDPDNWVCEDMNWDGSTYEYIDPSEHFVEFVKTGECRLRVLAAELVGNGNFRTILDQISNLDMEDERAQAEAEAAICNSNMKIYLAYTDDNTKAANVVMDIARDEWQDYNGVTHYDYYTEPILVFGDGSKYAFESYFTQNRFSSLFGTIGELADAYAAIVR